MVKTIAIVYALGLCSITVGNTQGRSHDPLAGAAAKQVSPIGRWYMGTACGFDCNLVITKSTMTVQYGGCFSKQNPIVVAWKQQGDKVTFDDAVLKQTLGTYLSIRSYRGKHDMNLLLVPENEQEIIQKSGYVYAHCFWKNRIANGLEWPRDAKLVGPGPEPTHLPPLKK